MEENRIVKGIWIPIEIWKDASLSWSEKILLLEVDSFTSQQRDCYFSDEYIADLLGVGITTANKILASLIRKGYVSKTRFDGRRRYIQSNLRVIIDGGSLAENDGAALQKSADQPCTKVQPSISNNNISIPLPFTGAEFISTWELLTQQPKWRKKSRAALEMSLKKLATYPERIAVRMMQNTIANDWQGLFPLKAEDEKREAREASRDRSHEAMLAELRELPRSAAVTIWGEARIKELEDNGEVCFTH